MEVYHYNLVAALIVSLTGIYTSTLVGWNPFWFSLDQLKWHSAISIERDASLCEYLLPSYRRIHATKCLFSHGCTRIILDYVKRLWQHYSAFGLQGWRQPYRQSQAHRGDDIIRWFSRWPRR